MTLPFVSYLVSPALQHCFSGDRSEILKKCKTDEILGRVYYFLMNDEKAKEKAVSILGGNEVEEILNVDENILKKLPPLHITHQNDEVLEVSIKPGIELLIRLGVEVVDNSVDNSFHS